MHPLRNFPSERDHLERQPLQLPDAGIVARQNPRRRQQLLQAIDNQIARPIHPLIQSLQREIRPVAVDNQSRQQIAFGKHQPVSVRVLNHTLAMRQRRRNALEKEGRGQ